MSFIPAPANSWLISYCKNSKQVTAEPLIGWAEFDDTDSGEYAFPVTLDGGGLYADPAGSCAVCGGSDGITESILGPATAAEVKAILNSEAARARTDGTYLAGTTIRVASRWGTDL